MLPVYDIDRIVFASSLAIHIIIASISIGMPFAIGTLELYGILTVSYTHLTLPTIYSV